MPERVRTDYGLRIDCGRNGCTDPCTDDGLVLARGNAQPTVERVNGHVVTAVERTVTYSTWTDVSTPPAASEGGR